MAKIKKEKKVKELVKVCKIKLFLVEKDTTLRNQMYDTLTKMAFEAKDIRQDTLKRCIIFNYFNSMNKHSINLLLGKRENGEAHTYSTFLTRTRNYSKFLSETQASWTQTEVENKFKNELQDYYRGTKSFPKFSDLSLIAKSKDSKIEKIGDDYFYYPSSLCSSGYVFGFSIPKKDKDYQEAIINRVISGEYKLGDSKIKKIDGIWYLLLNYKFKAGEKMLDPDIICGIDLGWAIPAVCGLNTGFERAFFGNSDAIKKFRTQIKSRRRKLQSVTTTKGGHGRKRKFKTLDSFREKESNWMQTYNHTLSKMIIDFCEKNNAGTIHMEALTKEVKKNSFLSQYWSYYQLQQMIENKAKEKNIVVNYIDPAYTSQMCSKCGHIDKENRKVQSKFKCVKCDHELNADYNASVNIARSKNIVEKTFRGEEDKEEAKQKRKTKKNYVSNDISLISQREGEGVRASEHQEISANPTH